MAGLSKGAVFSYFDTRVSAYATLSSENGALVILEYVNDHIQKRSSKKVE